MPTETDVHAKTRGAGQVLFVGAALALSALLLALIGRETVWAEDTRLFAQPRFWPAVALFLMVAGFGLHFWLMRRRRPARLDWQEARRWLDPLEFMLWFMAFVFIVPILGFLPMSVVFALGLCWRLGYRSRETLVIAAIFAVAVVVIFKALLGVKIPGALVYEWLPDGLRSFFLQYL